MNAFDESKSIGSTTLNYRMIPRFKPYLEKEELLAALRPDQGAVEKFEVEFARTFEAKYALAFPYGRSALWPYSRPWTSMMRKSSCPLIPARWLPTRLF